MRRLGIVSVMGLAGCIFDPSIDGQTAVSCKQDDDCVAEQFCRQRTGRCTLREEIPPGPVNDLTVTGGSETALSLEWTAVGDDGYQAYSQAERYAVVLHPAADPGAVQRRELQRTPLPANSRETLLLGDLTAGTYYRIWLEVSDDADNFSNSNEVGGATDGTVACNDDTACPPGFFCVTERGECTLRETSVPGPINDLEVVITLTTNDSITLQFTAPGDDGFTPGTRAQRYQLLIYDPLIDTPFATRDIQRIPLLAYQIERLVADGLERGANYRFQVRAIDDAGNESLSNLVATQTGGRACTWDEDRQHWVAPLEYHVVTAVQFVPLIGCEEIETLVVDNVDCSISDLSALRSLQRVGRFEIYGNPLCGNLIQLDLPALREASLSGAANDQGGLMMTRVDAETVDLPRLETVGQLLLDDNEQLATLHAPQLRRVTNALRFAGNGLTSVELPALSDAGDIVVQENPRLTAFDLSGCASVSLLHFARNASLAEIHLPQLATTLAISVQNNPQLRLLDAGALTGSSASFLLAEGNDALEEFALPELRRAAQVTLIGNQRLASVDLPRIEELEGLTLDDAPALVAVDLGSIGYIGNLTLVRTPGLASLVAPSLARLKTLELAESGLPDLELHTLTDADQLLIADNPSLTQLHLPTLTSLLVSIEVNRNPQLTRIDLPLLPQATTFRVAGNPALARIEAPSLMQVQTVDLAGNDTLVEVLLPQLAHVSTLLRVADNGRLVDVELPQLLTVNNLELARNDSLVNVEMSALASANAIEITADPALVNLEFPALGSVDREIQVLDNAQLAGIALPWLSSTTTIEIAGNSWLTSFTTNRLVTVLAILLRDNPLLAGCGVLAANRDRWKSSLCNIDLQRNADDSACHPCSFICGWGCHSSCLQELTARDGGPPALDASAGCYDVAPQFDRNIPDLAGTDTASPDQRRTDAADAGALQ